MKRIVIAAVITVFAASMSVYAELSPDRSHVKISRVPAQCLDSGSAVANGMKYTCTKIDTAEVWNESEVKTFEKDIFEAYRQPLPQPEPAAARYGLVVRQDSSESKQVVQTVTSETKEAADVDRHDGYKYSYKRK